MIDFEKIRLLVKKNDLNDALNSLQNQSDSLGFNDDIISLSTQLDRIEKESRLGIHTSEFIDIKKNRITFSILNIINKLEAEQVKGNDLQSQKIEHSQALENTIIELSLKIEEIISQMMKNDSIYALRRTSSIDYKDLIKRAINAHANKNLDEKSQIQSILNKLKGNGKHEKGIEILLQLLEENPSKIAEAYISHRQKESQIDFCRNQLEEYKKLYQRLEEKSNESDNLLKAFIVSSFFTSRLTQLARMSGGYNDAGYNIFGVNYYGVNKYGLDQYGASILINEIGISPEVGDTLELNQEEFGQSDEGIDGEAGDGEITEIESDNDDSWLDGLLELDI